MKRVLSIFVILSVHLVSYSQSNLLDDLVARYPFNGDAVDASGHGHDGTVYGPALTTDRFNQSDAAFDFDGTDDYIEIPDHPDLVFGDDPFSLVAWIYPEAWTGNTGLNCIISKANADEGAWLLRVVNSPETGNVAKLNFEADWPAQRFFGNSEVSLNAWHMVALTRNGDNFTFYLDGTADGTFTCSKSFISAFPVRISGQGDKTDERFNGKIDDVFIYDKELGSQEIADIYDLTRNACLHAPYFSYGGQVYSTVQIGYQCWMAENLNYGTMIAGTTNSGNNGVVEKYCYNNDPNNCDNLGGTFYQWSEAMNYTSGESVQGICPDGWHLPSTVQWCEMEQNIDPTVNCPVSGWHGTDVGLQMKVGGASGFEGILTGIKWDNGQFASQGLSSGYWTTTWGWSNMVSGYGLAYDHDDAEQGYSNWYTGLSVRCLKNNTPPYSPENPAPEIGSVNIYSGSKIFWSCSDPENEPLTYSVYLGIDPDPPFQAGNLAEARYTLPVLDFFTKYYWKIVAIDIHGDSTAGPVWYFRTRYDFCPDTLTDPRDGQKYAVFANGYQCWMAENLNHGTMVPGGASMSNNGVIEKYCYNDDPLLCDNEQRTFYQWSEAMNYTSGESVQGICPDGWHLPSAVEWCEMEQNIDPSISCPATGWHGTDIGLQMKVGGNSGFEAILAGDRWDNGQFALIDQSVHYWTTTWGWTNMVDAHGLLWDHDDAEQGYSNWYTGHCIRCIMDNQPPGIPEDPYPETGSMNIYLNTYLAWSCTDPAMEPLSYTLYFGTDPNPPLLAVNLTDTVYNPPPLDYYKTYYWKIVATDVQGDSTIGPVWSFKTRYDFCPDTLTDPRDGHKYALFANGYQCWMAQNLNHGTMIPGTALSYNNGVVEKYCYNDDPYNCDNLGGTFYQWNEAMNFTGGESVQGICPDGWHLPSAEEWCNMEQNIDPTISCPVSGWHGTDVGLQMKVGGSSGFEGILTGVKWDNGQFASQGLLTNFWTTTWGWSNMVLGYGLAHDHDDADNGYSNWYSGHCVRCLRDNQPPFPPENPFPEHGSIDIMADTVLHWSCLDPEREPLYFSLYLGTYEDPPYFAGGITDTLYLPGNLSYDSTYYWKVVAYDVHGDSTTGEIWNFTTRSLNYSEFLWAGQAGNIQNTDEGFGIVMDEAGNSFVTGFFTGTAVFGDTILTGNQQDIFIAKIDPYGKYVWVVQGSTTLNGEGRDISIDHNGDLIVTGHFSGSVTFGSNTLVSTGVDDIFICKLDQDGNFIWSISAGGAELDWGLGCSSDLDRNTYITGYFISSANFGSTTLTSYGDKDVFISKIDVNGNFLWAVQGGGSETDEAWGISCDPNGNILVTGFFKANATFGTTTLTSYGQQDVFVTKLDPNGTFIWTKQAGDNDYDRGFDITADKYGNSYVTGGFMDTIACGSDTLKSLGSEDIFIMKLDESGNFIWTRRAGGTELARGWGIDSDSSGNVYATGMFRGTADFGNIVVSTYGVQDIFITILDSNGNFIDSKFAYGNDWSFGLDVSANSIYDIRITGTFKGTFFFGQDSLSTNLSYYDMYIARIGNTFSCGRPIYDPRDTLWYNTVQVGQQCWMAENLNTGARIDGSVDQTDNGITEKYCYNDDPSNCSTYGGLYEWEEALAYSTEAGQICPPGWRIPSDGEICTMEQAIDTTVVCGSLNWRGTDGGTRLKQGGSSGMDILFAGVRRDDGIWEGLAQFGNFWSTDAEFGTNAWYRGVDMAYTQIFRNSLPAEYALPVRCVFDNAPPLAPHDPVPVHGSMDIYPAVELGWNCSDPDLDPLTYDIYLGPDTIPPLLVSGISETNFSTEFLTTDTLIFWRVVARDIHGAETSSDIWEFRTIPFDCGTTTFQYAGVTYGTVKYKNRCWLDRNLGASQVATAWDDPDSYGYYNQWGRFMDGHQIPASATTTTLSSTDDPGHGDFILADPIPYDWRSPQNDSLWQDNNRTNNPCPRGFYVPTEAEWTDAIYGWTSGTNAFNSALKLSANGYRSRVDGGINLTGSDGYYQASGVTGINHIYLWAGSGASMMYNGERAGGIAVRCIMKNIPPAVPYDPFPPHGSTDRWIADTLKWKCRDDNGEPLYYNIYWGFDPDPPLMKSLHNTNYYSDPLFAYDTLIYWRIEATDMKDTVSGPVWTFRTSSYNGNEYVWAKNLASSTSVSGDISNDEDGNIFITGYYYGDISFGSDTLSSLGGSEIFIVKMDKSGNYLWARSAGGTDYDRGYGIAPDNLGNVYVTGSFRGTAFFGSTSHTSYGWDDYFVCKLDENGNFLWSDHWGMSSNDSGHDISTDSAGNAYLTGTFYNNSSWGGTNSREVLVHKYLPDGWREWMLSIRGDQHDVGLGICTDDYGYSYITGYFRDTIALNNDTIATHGGNDVFVAKFSTDGIWQWLRSAGSIGDDKGYGIATDNYGSLFITGYCEDQALFGNDTLAGYGSRDIFTAKMDTAGNFKWVKPAGGNNADYGYGIDVDDAGVVYTTGKFQNSAEFGDTIVNGIRNSGLFVARFSNSGSYEWVKTAECTQTIEGTSITVHSGGDLYITGYFQYQALFGSRYLSNQSSTVFVSQVVEGSMKEVSLKAMLQGPYDGSSMSTSLNPANLPLSQPYSDPPWNYDGYEEVVALPSGDIVDWVLIELRDAPDASSATAGTTVSRKAAFLKNDGAITGLDGNSNLFFNEGINHGMYAVVWHRNHLAILSAQSLKMIGGAYSLDFTTSSTQAYGGTNAQKELAPGVWGMIGGDGNADKQVNNGDKNDVWAIEAGTGGYKAGDFDMNGQVNNGDKNDIWVPNTGLGSQVPDFVPPCGTKSGKPD